MPSDPTEPAEDDADPRGRAVSGPRHAAPRKSLLTKLHVPAGKAVALAAMPTAVLMGMGMTPHLAHADERPAVPFKPGPCVTQSETPSASATPSATPSVTPSGTPSATSSAADGTSGGPEGTDGATATPTPSESPAAARPGIPEPAAGPSASATAHPHAAPGHAPHSTPHSTPAPTATAPAAPPDPLGLGNLLGGLLGGNKSAPKPTPTPTPKPTAAPTSTPGSAPTTRAPEPPATGTAPAAPGPTAAPPPAKPSSGATKGSTGAGDHRGAAGVVKGRTDAAGTPSPSASPGAGATAGTAAEGDGGKQAYPCPTYDAEALSDAPVEEGIPLLPDRPWILKSNLLTLHNLQYVGIRKVLTWDRTVKEVMKFTATGVEIGDLQQIVQEPDGTTTHVTARAGSTSTISNGTVTMYTESLSGNLLGVVPITFTPKAPPPLTLPLLWFTDATVTQAAQFGGDLFVPGMRVLPGQPAS
ncbi:hypothetical protein ACFO3J_04990 [Streptomyces polygonati]|uniref:Hydrogenase expression protein HypF n=1 Tax=Streptomyces polygonati TaxID=1617087 RepID=A0ABV8HI51_9ACTN